RITDELALVGKGAARRIAIPCANEAGDGIADIEGPAVLGDGEAVGNGKVVGHRRKLLAIETEKEADASAPGLQKGIVAGADPEPSGRVAPSLVKGDILGQWRRRTQVEGTLVRVKIIDA